MQVEIEQIDGRRMRITARGNEVIVDDTIEDGGPGDGFRPSELLMGALGTCTIGTMITFARNQGIDVSKITMHVEDESLKAPSRIGTIRMTMSLETDADDRRTKTLERVAGACKIHTTLRTQPEVTLEFNATRT